MKKILITLGTIGACISPIASSVACGSSSIHTIPKGYSEGESTILLNMDKLTSAGTQPGAFADGHPRTQAFTKFVQPYKTNNEYYTQVMKLLDYQVSQVTEDPFLAGMLTDVTSAPRDFYVYDNGLFKIKIEKSLVGNLKTFKGVEAADYFVTRVTLNMNIGPAIFHLKKGIQILKSSAVASLGGEAGVQIALNGVPKESSIDIDGVASLVTHEYGHHETMWDIAKTTGKAIDRSIVNKALDGAGLSLFKSTTVLPAGETLQDHLAFVEGKDKTIFPSDYDDDPEMAKWVDLYPKLPSVFGEELYPFSPSETATRIQNIVSATLSSRSSYFWNGAFTTSELTYAHHRNGDGIFNEGKTDTGKRIMESWLDNIYQRNNYVLDFNFNGTKNKIDGAGMLGFGTNTDQFKKIVFKNNSGDIVYQYNISQEFSTATFGAKSSLLSDSIAHTWAYKMFKPKTEKFTTEFTMFPTDGITMEIQDENSKAINLSHVHVSEKNGYNIVGTLDPTGTKMSLLIK